jgi:F-type H+-transporting ATPase subunit delta
MTDRKLATRYARALLATLPDTSSQDSASTLLDALAQALEGDATLRRALVDPAVPSAMKSQLLASVSSGPGVPDRVRSFLATVVANGRTAALPTMAAVFREEKERAQGIVTGTLTTASPVGDELASRAAAALSRLSGRRVRLELRVDPDLLGGGVAQVGSMVYDGSVRTQLGLLKNRIAKE